MAWTPERIEALRRLHAQGLSYRQIAAELDLSRNSVIGKMHRLELTTTERQGAAKLPPPAKTNACAPPAVDPDLPWHHRLFAGLTSRMCHYPFGDLADESLRFCGEAVRGPGAAYCEEHHALCHTRGVSEWLRAGVPRARKRREAA